MCLIFHCSPLFCLCASTDGCNSTFVWDAEPVVSDPIMQDSLNPRSSALVVSEFVGCSPSLSGAIRVNPWNVSDVADSLYEVRQLRMSALSSVFAIQMPDSVMHNRL